MTAGHSIFHDELKTFWINNKVQLTLRNDRLYKLKLWNGPTYMSYHHHLSSIRSRKQYKFPSHESMQATDRRTIWKRSIEKNNLSVTRTWALLTQVSRYRKHPCPITAGFTVWHTEMVITLSLIHIFSILHIIIYCYSYY